MPRLSLLISTTTSWHLARKIGADHVINGREVEDVPARIRELTGGGASRCCGDRCVEGCVQPGYRVGSCGRFRGGCWSASEMMELSIVKIVLDGIRVVGSLVGTRQDLAEAFQFGADGIVVPVVQLREVDEAPAVFEEMTAGKITGRMVLDFASL